MTQEEWIRMQTAMKPVREKAKQQQPQKKEEAKRLPPFGPLGKKLIGS
ncbi:hypothetical protein [Kroppenstedtia sanguinis]|uniref:YqzE-like protein n=1 Tax=Kroppenstedtia sanguinis TaxID=1380684 RepID=A0ABW4CCH5_9BACL